MLNIFVLIDALGWHYVEKTGFLSDCLPYRRPLRTILGYSCGAIPSILTGMPPTKTGHWNLFYYDPANSPFRWLKFTKFLPTGLADNRVSRKVMKELGRRVLGMGPLFECSVSPRLLPWFNYVEKKNIYSRRGIGGAKSVFDELADRGIAHRVYSYHILRDSQIFEQAIRDIRSGVASFFFLYLSEMDMFLHMHCREIEEVRTRLKSYDQQLREVLRAAREVDSDASMTVISDHGMTPVQRRYNLVKDIGRLRFEMPDDYLAVYDSTMARFWFFNDAAKTTIANFLEKLRCGRILTDEELQKLGILFPDRRFGELIFLLNPGWMLSESDFNGNGWNPKGMHGYDPADPFSDAIFLTNREPSVPPQTITDIFPYMQSAAGLAG